MKTFNQIVPKWSKKLKKGYREARSPCYVDDTFLDISAYRHCIVGEAYGFKKGGNYSTYDSSTEKEYCVTCRDFADAFDRCLGDLASSQNCETDTEKEIYDTSENRFKRLKKSFAGHWNKNHLYEDK